MKAKPKAGLKGRGPLGIPKWGWIALLVAGVAMFIYIKRRNASSTKASTSPPQGTGVDDQQLASDIAAQLAAALGGTPASTDPGAAGGGPDLSDFLNQLAANQQGFLDQFSQYESQLAAGGISQPGWYSQPPSWYSQPYSQPNQAPVQPNPYQPAPNSTQTGPYGVPSGFIGVAPSGGVNSAAYNPSSGVTITPTRDSSTPSGFTEIAPTVSYSSKPGGVTGPSIFAFK